jgi:hypothetical protein
MLNVAPAPSRVSCASVTFEPGARSAWHTHPLGQTLIVTAGCGWTQCEGEAIVEVRAGDVIWCPPGQKHWHGATSTTHPVVPPHVEYDLTPPGREVSERVAVIADWIEVNVDVACHFFRLSVESIGSEMHNSGFVKTQELGSSTFR